MNYSLWQGWTVNAWGRQFSAWTKRVFHLNNFNWNLESWPFILFFNFQIKFLFIYFLFSCFRTRTTRDYQDHSRTLNHATYLVHEGLDFDILTIYLGHFLQKIQFSLKLLKLLSWNFVDMLKINFYISPNKDFVHSMKNNLIIVWNSHKELLLPEYFSHFEALKEWDFKLYATYKCKRGCK